MGWNAREIKPGPMMSTPQENVTQERATLRVAVALFLLGTLTAAFYAFVFYPRQGMVDTIIDLNGFGKLGRNLAAGQGFSLGDGPTMRRAPLYPAFVALLLRIFGNSGPDAVVYRPVMLAQCFMVGLSCVTAYTLGRKLFDMRTGVVAGVLCALTPQVLRYAGMTEVETTMGLLIALMALTSLNLTREPNLKNGVLLGLVCGAAALVKAVSLLYLPLFAVLFIWKFRRAQRETTSSAVRLPLVPIGAAFAMFILCLLPWSIRNILLTNGQFKGISSNGSGEFLRAYKNVQPKFFLLKQDFGGGDPSRLQWDAEANLYEDELLRQHGTSFLEIERVRTPAEQKAGFSRVQNELLKERIENAEMKRRIFHEPLDFLRKFVIQLFTFWYIVETRKKSLMVGGIAAVILALALFGWVRARRRHIDATPIVSVVLYFNIIYALFLSFARYSMPVFPTLLVLTAYGVTQLRPGQPDSAVTGGSSLGN